MAQYIIRKNKHDYELAKFEDSDSPTDVYTISARGCNCPSRFKNCKHNKMLSLWKKGGEVVGQVYDDNLEILGTLNVQ